MHFWKVNEHDRWADSKNGARVDEGALWRVAGERVGDRCRLRVWGEPDTHAEGQGWGWGASPMRSSDHLSGAHWGVS